MVCVCVFVCAMADSHYMAPIKAFSVAAPLSLFLFLIHTHTHFSLIGNSYAPMSDTFYEWMQAIVLQSNSCCRLWTFFGYAISWSHWTSNGARRGLVVEVGAFYARISANQLVVVVATSYFSYIFVFWMVDRHFSGHSDHLHMRHSMLWLIYTDATANYSISITCVNYLRLVALPIGLLPNSD